MTKAGAMLETYPADLGGVDRQALTECIQACFDCAQTCAEACRRCEKACRQLITSL